MEKIILGIDPGTNIMGYALLKVSGKALSVIDLGVIELSKLSNHYLKLQKIHKTLFEIIDTYCPDEMALEAPFYGKNVQSMLKLGRAQGVAMAVGLSRELVITEYAPRKIKLAITGTGAAAKEQVAAILSKMLNFDHQKYLDATDALAVAVCHYYQLSKPEVPSSSKKSVHHTTSKKSSQSWEQFIVQHADRVVKK